MKILLMAAAGWLVPVALTAQIDLLRPPEAGPGEDALLAPLLLTDAGRQITSKSGWDTRREAIREKWATILGPMRLDDAPLEVETHSVEEEERFTRTLVSYQVEEGIRTDAYLLIPKDAGEAKLPAVVVFHSTVKAHARLVAGIDSPGDDRAQGVHLAGRGYVVLCPRNYIFTEGAGYAGNAEKVHRRNPDRTGMARMIGDAIRAADFLETLPHVDSKRIGAIGHSLGAKVALYAGAFDERYKAVVASEGGIGLQFSNWEAPWYLGSRIREPGFTLENHQVLALLAPRAFLLLAGESADNDRSWAFIRATLPVYELLGARENIGWFNHGLGHRYPPEARQVAEAFLDLHLRRVAISNPRPSAQ